MSRTGSLRGLAGWLVLTIGGGAVVGYLSNSGVSPWYAALDKPSWTPPPSVFGPVWTTLYALMGTAAWMVWTRTGQRLDTPAIVLFLVQLALNFAWSFLFFSLQAPGLALVEILMLWVSIVLTMLMFSRQSTAAAALLVPYLLWVTYATALNAAIVRAN